LESLLLSPKFLISERMIRMKSVPKDFKENYYKMTYEELQDLYKVSRTTIYNWKILLNLSKISTDLKIPDNFIYNYYNMTYNELSNFYNIPINIINRWKNILNLKKRNTIPIPDDFEENVELYSIAELAERYNVSHNLIYFWKLRIGEIKDAKIKQMPEDFIENAKLYSVTELSKKYNVSHSLIYRWLTKLNIKPKIKNKPRPIPDEFKKDMEILSYEELSNKYKISRSTIIIWKRILSNNGSNDGSNNNYNYKVGGKMLDKIELYIKDVKFDKLFLREKNVNFSTENGKLNLSIEDKFNSIFKFREIKNIELNLEKDNIKIEINSNIIVLLYSEKTNELLNLWDKFVNNMYYKLEDEMMIRKNYLTEKILNNIKSLGNFDRDRIKNIINLELVEYLRDYKITIHDKNDYEKIIVIENLKGNVPFNIRKNEDMINDFLNLDIKIKLDNQKIKDVKYIKG
jgi:transposase